MRFYALKKSELKYLKTLGKLGIITEVNVNDTTSEEGFSFP